MLAVALKVLTLYVVAILGFAIGVAISSDIKRWLKARQQSRQHSGERLGGSVH